ncbi:1,4-alpha-glucan branching protein GlgB [Aminobacterium colombiense]|jgi:1,4-alpha-glucan branching enzyme|uniref:1,4-alpha-glucan branching enzyme GlgB n=1 Tax=Aminobacterium colombiense (strain DSM 12261 / ALA-1) TaxID=572547 RepID=D5ECU9_AMICL|nr:1,4-alpha-glucan branching protein GlgB [Aminobacterium colombiense]ADE56381.1 1,4-alpha-glucan branching enzyme [Aminobacterium colombiense DSM 12261]MDD2379181.1 1,4-alpha-glucan branching protein GlgB [Aminobacterium colombiense]
MKNFKVCPSLFSDLDTYLFKEGTHLKLYEKMGAHPLCSGETQGVYFALWAPNASQVSVIGDFNLWNPEAAPLSCRPDESGIWEGFVSSAFIGDRYKYRVVSKRGEAFDKGDPFAFAWEELPGTASIIASLHYQWNDHLWAEKRKKTNWFSYPLSIYEVHLGSWMRKEGKFLSYREIAEQLTCYVKKMGFTAVEIMPLMEHPFYGSWGYQITGFFAPTSRYGSPQDLMFLIDTLHQADIAVFLDWVPSHFPSDEHGLAYLDGTALFEHADPRQKIHPEWRSYIFNYGRTEVREFLINSALFWLDYYHVDGLRFDGVASMLYLDYARKEGEWVPNRYGGRENIEAVSFLRRLNEAAHLCFPHIVTIAEESSAWPLVTRPSYVGGLGFGMKWNMGWMHDILKYMELDPLYRQYHHNDLTFSLMYAFSENYVLPFSHDEVVYGKRSLLEKMPGTLWQKFAQLRLLLGFMYAHPGKKLLFMGSDIAQRAEWNHEESLHWNLLKDPFHSGMQLWVRDINRVYFEEKALHEKDFSSEGFQWIDCSDSKASVLGFIRRDGEEGKVLAIFNFTPVVRHNYLVGVPEAGYWRELLNSDGEIYGGMGEGNMGGKEAMEEPLQRQPCCLSLTLPSFGALFFRKEG